MTEITSDPAPRLTNPAQPTSTMPPWTFVATPSAWPGRIAGAIAMLLALATLVGLRAATGLISLLDALAEVTIEIMPMALFSRLLGIFETDAKAALLVGIVVVITLMGAWIGPLLLPTPGSRSRVIDIFRPIRAVLLLSATGIGFLYWAIAERDSAGFTYVQMLTAAGCVVAGAVVYSVGTPLIARLLLSAPVGVDGTATGTPRRAILRAVAGALVVIPAVVLGREVWRTRSGGFLSERRSGTLSSAITPTDEFYTVSSNFRDPTGDGGPEWRLTVDGLVDRPLELTLADIQAMADPDLAVTLNCISNEIGGPLISTGLWNAAPLARFLAEASPQTGVVDVVFEGRDGYTDSIPLQKALAPECHLAWGMNGEALPAKHGAPLRALIPGIYGIKSVKWLERITLVDSDHKGYWQERGWTDDGTIKAISRIDTPVDRDVLRPQPTEIGGVAWAGVAGVDRVEVSTDDGATWTDAEIPERPGPYAWVVWRLPWTPSAGTYDITVRLIDSTGALQLDTGDSTLPDGATGWHRITVGVI